MPLFALLFACVDETVPMGVATPEEAGDVSGPVGDPGQETGPTWHADVAPIVAARCGACHVAGGIAPFPLDSYASAGPMAPAMLAAVESGAMPPWSAESTDECEPRFGWAGDMRLSDAEKATLRAWVEAGAPEGDAATAAPLPAAPDLGLADPDQVVAPELPYVASGDADQFRCFSMDPGLTADAWLTGLQVLPGNEEVVHHVVVFSDVTGESERLAGDEGSYECFGGMGLALGSLLGAWAPGAFPFQAPAGTGIRVPAGARIVMQVHYHPAGAVAAPDVTAVQLRWADAPPAREAMLALLGNASSAGDGLLPGPNDRGSVEFRIPAGASGHTETIEYTLPRYMPTLSVFAAGTHMHYVGTDMLVEVDHADPEDGEPATECLVQTPRWDFDWQRAYAYDAPLDQVPTLRGGDTLRLRCTYDNTLANPGTAEALEDAGLEEPVDVWLGEETLDEMCLGVLGVVL